MKKPLIDGMIAIVVLFVVVCSLHWIFTRSHPSISPTDLTRLIDNVTWVGTKYWPDVDTVFMAINGRDTVAYACYWHKGATPGAPPDSSRVFYWNANDLQAIDEGITVP
jgi:hypothetical protein